MSQRADRWYCPSCGAIAATPAGEKKRNKCLSCVVWMRSSLGPRGIRAWVARRLIWILVRFNHELPLEKCPILEGEILQMVHTATWQKKKKRKYP